MIKSEEVGPLTASSDSDIKSQGTPPDTDNITESGDIEKDSSFWECFNEMLQNKSSEKSENTETGEETPGKNIKKRTKRRSSSLKRGQNLEVKIIDNYLSNPLMERQTDISSSTSQSKW